MWSKSLGRGLRYLKMPFIERPIRLRVSQHDIRACHRLMFVQRPRGATGGVEQRPRFEAARRIVFVFLVLGGIVERWGPNLEPTTRFDRDEGIGRRARPAVLGKK